MSGCILLPSELKDKIEGIKNVTPQLQGVVYKEFLRRTNNEEALPLGNDDQIKEAIAKFNQFLQQSKQQSGVAQATPSSNKPTTTYDQILADTKEVTISKQRFNYKLENGQVTLYQIANGRLYQYETIKFPSNGWKGIEQSLPRLKRTELANEALEDENEDA